MKITSVKFLRGITDDNAILGSNIPQIAFIGRSNVGKSSLINTLTNSKIARASSFPGRTQEINIFLVNNAFHFVDLPGYGFARASGAGRQKLTDLIDSYLFNSHYDQKKVVLIIDANTGFTGSDKSMLAELEHHNKDIVIVANKIDRLKQSEYHKQMTEIKMVAGRNPVIEFSSTNKIGIKGLLKEII